MADKPTTVLTIGHSNHTYDYFLSLLREVGVTAIADVRTSPYSKHYSHFNRDELQQTLKGDQIAYVYLGDELGGRPKDKALLCEGVADYEKMAMTGQFEAGLNRVIQGAENHSIALLCSEQNPTECHRCLLVGRALLNRGVRVEHILSDGNIVTQENIEEELLKLAGAASDDFFMSRDERLAVAYHERSRKVAYSEMTTEKPASKQRIAS